jgi:hypothetical protein
MVNRQGLGETLGPPADGTDAALSLVEGPVLLVGNAVGVDHPAGVALLTDDLLAGPLMGHTAIFGHRLTLLVQRGFTDRGDPLVQTVLADNGGHYISSSQQACRAKHDVISGLL